MNSKSFVLVIVAIVLIFRLAQTWMAHKQANRKLDVLKSYADQGKEPPPQLLDALRPPETDRAFDRWNLPRRNWVPFGLFLGLTAGFLFALSGIAGDDGGRGGLFIGLIMAGLAIGYLGNILSAREPKQDRNDQRIPPP